jgi:hypothetical protein
MKIELNIPDNIVEKVVRDIMDNFPEAGSGMSLMCIDWKYKSMDFIFVDCEEDKKYTLDKAKLIAAFPLMYSEKWPKGCTKLPTSDLVDEETWDDWLCQADAVDFDAFVQLACLGEVIYG